MKNYWLKIQGMTKTETQRGEPRAHKELGGPSIFFSLWIESLKGWTLEVA